MHHFILIQIDRSIEIELKVNLTQEQIKTQYNDKFEQKLTGPLYNVLGKLLQPIAGIDRIIIPGGFKSALDGKSEAIQCQVKVSDGHLYPLKNALIFIQKPILYIKHNEIKYVEFSRIGSQIGVTGKSFDISIVKIDSDGGSLTEQFKNIDKQELRVMIEYFKSAGIKMRQIDPDTHKGVDLEDYNSDDVEQEIKQSQENGTVGKSGRRRVPVPGAVGQNDDDSQMDEEDSDDESFNDQQPGSDDESGDEEGEEDLDDDIDDDKIGKDELGLLKGNRIVDKKDRKKK
jgi:structure-specific recognition protein 1